MTFTMIHGLFIGIVALLAVEAIGVWACFHQVRKMRHGIEQLNTALWTRSLGLSVRRLDEKLDEVWQNDE